MKRQVEALDIVIEKIAYSRAKLFVTADKYINPYLDLSLSEWLQVSDVVDSYPGFIENIKDIILDQVKHAVRLIMLDFTRYSERRESKLRRY